MSAKTRLQKLESARPKGAVRIAIHYEHADTVRAEFTLTVDTSQNSGTRLTERF